MSEIKGAEHPETLGSMNKMALVLTDRGKYKHAEDMHRQALGLRETVLGAEYLSTLTSMNNLGLVLSDQASTSKRKRCINKHSG